MNNNNSNNNQQYFNHYDIVLSSHILFACQIFGRLQDVFISAIVVGRIRQRSRDSRQSISLVASKACRLFSAVRRVWEKNTGI